MFTLTKTAQGERFSFRPCELIIKSYKDIPEVHPPHTLHLHVILLVSGSWTPRYQLLSCCPLYYVERFGPSSELELTPTCTCGISPLGTSPLKRARVLISSYGNVGENVGQSQTYNSFMPD